MTRARDWTTILEEHQAVIGAMRAAEMELEAIAEALISALRDGRRVFVFGNGGSAADAQHIAGELLGRFRIADRPALPALALTTDSSTLTAIANDLAYDQIFARQLGGLLLPGDVAWALSTSGNSPNIVHGASVARERGGIVIGFTGQTGGRLAPLCHHVFAAPHTSSDRIQEAHVLAYHYLCEKVEAALAVPH